VLSTQAGARRSSGNLTSDGQPASSAGQATSDGSPAAPAGVVLPQLLVLRLPPPPVDRGRLPDSTSVPARPVPGRPSRSLTRVGAWLLAVLAAVGLLVFGAGTASAHTLPDAGNRVRASAPETITAVGVSEHVRAGQGRGPPVLQGQIVVATGVAAETGAAASRLLSPSSLADEVANATGGVLKANKGGFTIAVPNGSRGIAVRVMERGGSRTNYYRVSVPGKEAYTVTGEASTDAALTHIDIGESSLGDILGIINRIQGGQ
jgi:hypothetical protein